MQDEYVSTEHLLLAIASEKEGDAGRILRSNGITRDDLEKVVTDMRGGSRITDQNAEENFQALDKYAQDLTERARKESSIPSSGVTTRSAGRYRSSRRTKNNPVLTESPAWVRLRSSRASLSGSSPETCPRH